MSQIKSLSFFFLILTTFCITSCTDDGSTELTIPTAYDGGSFSSNTGNQIALVNQLTALTDEAKKGRIATNTVTRAALENLFNTGSPALAAEITPYFKSRLEGDQNWFDELAKASGKTWTPQAPQAGAQGGVYGGYLFDENGLEIEQLVEKGQFNATLYQHATKLMSGTLTSATVDQLLAVYGATPSFANSGSNNVQADARDRAMANYGARRDKNDGTGLYTQMKTAFITLQAAVRAGSGFSAEQTQAVEKIQDLWEKINAATVINYCHSAISTLSNTNPTEAQVGGALHAIGEGIGFIHGFRTVDQRFKRITDGNIDEILGLFNAPSNGTATVYRFATSPATELPKLQQIISRLKAVYGFSDQEIEDFKTNWVAQQGR